MSKQKWAVNRVRESLSEIPTENLPTHLRPTLLLAATFANPDGSDIYPSAGTLAEILGLARSTVSDHLLQLHQAGVLVNTGVRKSWSQYVNTAVRNIDFGVLEAMTLDGLERQTMADGSERQPSETDDGETRRLTVRTMTDDGPERHNLPNHPLNQDGVDSVETSSTSPMQCPNDGRALAFKDGECFCACGYTEPVGGEVRGGS